MASEDLELTVGERTVTISNPDKVLFPNDAITKADLADYYRRIGETMLATIADRPLTLVRHPKGIGSKGFFQKHTPDHYPPWIGRVELKKKDGVVRHAVVTETAALVYFAQQNVITPHIGLARTDDLQRPDLFVVDLDPSVADMAQLRRVALAVKDGLERAGLVPFVQLSGSKGVHVFAPLDRSATWSEIGRFGRALTGLLLAAVPDDLTTEFSKAERGDRIYLDMGRNNYQSTVAAPYGVRAVEGAAVVTPISWEELHDEELDPRRYDIRTVFDRLERFGDPFAELAIAARPLPS